MPPAERLAAIAALGDQARLSIDEAVIVSGLPRRTLARLMAAGEIPVVRDGRRVFILAGDLRARDERLRARWDGTPWQDEGVTP
jgi:hypothetical protein